MNGVLTSDFGSVARLVDDPAGGDRSARQTVAIIGAGPAGLTAALHLLSHSDRHHPIVVEETGEVGGIARTAVYRGYRFDIGGHRFFTKNRAVDALWRSVLPHDFLRRPRLSRIFYRQRYFAYPLKLFDALAKIGVVEAIRIVLSYAKAQCFPHAEERNFEQWVTNRFGARLFAHFFKTYTEKVWGIPCATIQADWAAQRIRNLSLRKAVWHALTGANDTASLIDAFDYPRLGPGMMWEAFRDRIVARGGDLRMHRAVIAIHHDHGKVRAIGTRDTVGGDGPAGGAAAERIAADQFISSMPLSSLVLAMSPAAPPAVAAAARRLRYRDFIVVALIVEGRDLFPDNWIYVHSPDVQVGRIQNFRSWSEAMVPDPARAGVGMEYFCQQGDALWKLSDDALVALATSELATLGLASADAVVDGTVVRQPKAYPVYDEDYRQAVDTIRDWLTGFANLQVVGRNGMHRYNNQDHSMLTAMLAVDNILGGEHDLWTVNADDEYHEFAANDRAGAPGRAGVDVGVLAALDGR